MNNQDSNKADQSPKSADQGPQPQHVGSAVDEIPDSARDREMGCVGKPLGDRGQGHKTWTPPLGEQGMSNRPGDEAEGAAGEPDTLEEDDALDPPEGSGEDIEALNHFRVRQNEEHQPGEDPAADTDPNAEGASLTEDPVGIEKVDELRREADGATPMDSDRH